MIFRKEGMRERGKEEKREGGKEGDVEIYEFSTFYGSGYRN